MAERTKVGVIGSGRISEQYLTNMISFFNNLEVVAIASAHKENADKRAQQFGISPCTVDELIADPAISVIVVLTPAPTHAELIEKALRAGKHVYTEKTMTVALEDAERLLNLASEKNLYLCSAPDTFMGAALQTAREAIDSGKIGTPVSFSLNINRNIDFLASIFEFLRMPGGGLAYDYGVYYLTALVSLLGPAHSVFAQVKNKAVERTNVFPQSPDFGKPYRYENESQIYGVINLENGISGTVSMNGDSCVQDLSYCYIYGSEGVLQLTCANDFGGEVRLVKSSFTPEDGTPVALVSSSPLTDSNRGVGPAEMADAIAAGRPARTDAHMAYHVLDIISAMMKSQETGSLVPVQSTCSRPEPFSDVARLCADRG